MVEDRQEQVVVVDGDDRVHLVRVADAAVVELEALAVLLLEPIHDGLHLLADRSPLCVEVEHTRSLLQPDRLRTAASGKSPTTDDQQKGEEKLFVLAGQLGLTEFVNTSYLEMLLAKGTDLKV